MGLLLGGACWWPTFSRSASTSATMGITGILIGERIYAYLTLHDVVGAVAAGLRHHPARRALSGRAGRPHEPVEALHSEQ